MSRILVWEAWNMEEDHNEGVSEALSEVYGVEEAEERQNKNIKTYPVMMSSFGFFPITEDNHPSKDFQIWKAHTNFRISEDNIKDICNVDGVEVFQGFSEYRFLIAVGRLFNPTTVKKNIQDLLNVEIKQDDRYKEMDLNTEEKEKFIRTSAALGNVPYFGVLMLPNSEMVAIKSQILDETFKKELGLMKAVYGAVGGKFIFNDKPAQS